MYVYIETCAYTNTYIYIHAYEDETLIALDQRRGRGKLQKWPEGAMRTQPIM